MAGAIITMLATRAYGGPLDPPGPPASTDGVRGPGTPISSLPFATTEGGYYYVTRNLSAGAGQSGITICCSNTTIDLGGFTLFGAGAGNSPGDGIYNAVSRNIVIRNGAVRGWDDGIDLGGTYSHVERIQALSNLSTGILVSGGSVVTDCNASLNANAGISAEGSIIRDCVASENFTGIDATFGSLVEGNRATGNEHGIFVSNHKNMIRSNQMSGNTLNDVWIVSGSTFDVLMDNLSCTAANFGSNTQAAGNLC